MKGPSKSQRDSRCSAVVRNFEPSRIERDLLAKVFETLSHKVAAQTKTSQPGSLSRSNDELAQAQNEVSSTMLCWQTRPMERVA